MKTFYEKRELLFSVFTKAITGDPDHDIGTLNEKDSPFCIRETSNGKSILFKKSLQYKNYTFGTYAKKCTFSKKLSAYKTTLFVNGTGRVHFSHKYDFP